MGTSKIRLNNPCQEKWENMSTTSNGKYCDSCVKNVIDFTSLNDEAIINLMRSNHEQMCARVSSSQINQPLISDLKKRQINKLPYSKVAASIILTVTSLSINAANEYQIIHPSSTVNDANGIVKPELSSIKKTNSSTQNLTTIQGSVFSEDKNAPLGRVLISFFTIDVSYSTFSKEDGTFELSIPARLISDSNVVRFSYENIDREDFPEFSMYEESTHVITRNELKQRIIVKASPMVFYVGEIGYVDEPDPIVVQNGIEQSYKQFMKALDGKPSTCKLTEGNFHYFEGEAAIALYGEKAKGGLYLIIDHL